MNPIHFNTLFFKQTLYDRIVDIKCLKIYVHSIYIYLYSWIDIRGNYPE